MTPIKPGTAARLGLRPPGRPTAGLFQFPREISDEQIEEFKKRWQENYPTRSPVVLVDQTEVQPRRFLDYLSKRYSSLPYGYNNGAT